MRTLHKRLVHGDVRLRDILVDHIDPWFAGKSKRFWLGTFRLRLFNIPVRKELLEHGHRRIPVHIAGESKNDALRREHTLGKAFHVSGCHRLVLGGIGIPESRVRRIVHLGLKGRQHLRRRFITALVCSHKIRLDDFKLSLIE